MKAARQARSLPCGSSRPAKMPVIPAMRPLRRICRPAASQISAPPIAAEIGVKLAMLCLVLCLGCESSKRRGVVALARPASRNRQTICRELFDRNYRRRLTGGVLRPSRKNSCARQRFVVGNVLSPEIAAEGFSTGETIRIPAARVKSRSRGNVNRDWLQLRSPRACAYVRPLRSKRRQRDARALLRRAMSFATLRASLPIWRSWPVIAT